MEDANIIALFFERNEQAVQETDTAYGRKLYALSNRILNSRQDAEESVNDTYMETWKTIPPQRPQYFYAFLASICRHVSFNRLDWRLAAKRNAEVVTLTQEMEACIPDMSRNGELSKIELRDTMELPGRTAKGNPPDLFAALPLSGHNGRDRRPIRHQ